ncbi:MAG: succinyl-diaminopimelate desuccinylase [Gammaproteobacteria bacterium]|nr:MAG: succinyl-diaminopimelate desuccinylase [Gammaproteobacteria bacterium]
MSDTSANRDDPTLALLIDLVRRPSVTPEDAGCQALIAERLAAVGFEIEHLPAAGVSNLWARLGDTAPLIAFAGHTDVVPPGDPDAWTHPPFSATIENGYLYGRGAADMKAGVAAMVTALERFVKSGKHRHGSLALLLTSDEEGPATDGTRHVIDTLAARGEQIDYCILGEPSSSEHLGDTLRNGRRGSLGARLVVNGVQGHVAYPELADNPVHRALAALDELCKTHWDKGNADFPPTTLQISNVAAGTGASNVIPGRFVVDFNLRYSTASTMEGLQQRIETILARHELDYRITWNDSARPFVTATNAAADSMQNGPSLVSIAREVVREHTGIDPETNTAGGTSDGRFIVPTGAELVELGPINKTIHQIDECVAVNDLPRISRIHEGILERLAGAHD